MRFTILIMIIGLAGASLAGKMLGKHVIGHFADVLVQPLTDSMESINEALQ